VLPALCGAVLGIPGGQALFAALSGDETASPPLWQVLAVIPATVVIVAMLTAVPARLAGRRPAVETLQAEFA
jgi:putative ABC transport system permease protein